MTNGKSEERIIRDDSMRAKGLWNNRKMLGVESFKEKIEKKDQTVLHS